MPRTVTQELAHASMEGNVRMPQNMLGIAVHTADRVLSQENPHAAVRKLIAPIPDGKELDLRTSKANAQHALHDVRRLLTTDDVRWILEIGNVSTLNFIAAALGNFKLVDPPERNVYDSHGEWATDELRARVLEVEDKLTPEKLEVLRHVVEVIRDELATPEMKALLAKRKELYDDWSKKRIADRGQAARDANRVTGEIVERLTRVIFEAGEEFPDRESKAVAQNIRMKIESFVPNY